MHTTPSHIRNKNIGSWLVHGTDRPTNNFFEWMDEGKTGEDVKRKNERKIYIGYGLPVFVFPLHK